ncbi:hypothetical protein [Frankia sp. AgB32]|uniref:hypothetical protein n=1 Tax=Frankia sp. AgB32 TaxID=631119 RepID=UPI00200C19C0|nr:hypothetical protein [Frankia sp. AgB32]MCK9897684.1 hypothetical protein [Frankia sp. AgB32]
MPANADSTQRDASPPPGVAPLGAAPAEGAPDAGVGGVEATPMADPSAARLGSAAAAGGCWAADRVPDC